VRLLAQHTTWPEDAIHDTVASIVRKPPYSGLRESLAGRLFRYLGDVWDRVFRAMGQIPGGRYVATACAALIVIVVAARLVAGRRLRDTADGQGGPAAGRGARRDPEAESRQLAAEGRYTEAAHALYAVVLMRVAARERLRLHASKTSGDYARELRAKSSATYGAFRVFSRRFDLVMFGVGVCTADDYAALLRDAASMIDDQRAA